MSTILTIAGLTLKELSRRRVVMAGLVLTAIVLTLAAWGFASLPRVPCGRNPCPEIQILSAAAVLLIMMMFMISFVIALGAAFLAAPAIASDIESGIALAMLPRPIRRRDVLVGKWLALAGVIILYTLAVGGILVAIVKYFTGYMPPGPLMAVAYIAAEGLMLLTLALLGSTRLGPMACGIMAVVLFGVTWMMGVAGAIGVAFQNQAVTNVGVIASLILPTDGLWRAAAYHLSPAILLATAAQTGVNGNPFIVAAPPTPAYHIWAALWIMAALALAIYSFEHRDL